MTNRFILLVALLLNGVLTTAQIVETSQPLIILPSPKGNYLVISPMKPNKQDLFLLKNTAYFQIERTEVSTKALEKARTKGSRIGIDTVGRNATHELFTGQTRLRASRPKTIAELRQLVGDPFLERLRKATSTDSDAALLTYLGAHPNPTDYSWLAASIELQQVLGNVYLDQTAKSGLVYYYRVFQVDAAGSPLPWSESFTVAGAENQSLKALKVRGSSVSGHDSLVTMTWKLPLSQFKPALPAQTPTTFDVEDPVFRKSMTVHLTTAQSVRGTVQVYEGNTWKAGPTLYPTANETGDTLLFTWQKPCVPEELVRACLIPQDLVYNPGSPSDTLTAVAVTNQHLIYIYAVKAQDTTDAIRLSWPRLPTKAYYTGIELMRDNGTDSTFVQLARLSAQDSVYVDYNVRPGVNYTYQIRPLFIPLQGLEQPVAAEAAGSCTKFSKPLPVADLQVGNEGRHIRLSWTGTGGPSLYGYYVYRGTSQTNLSLVSGVVRNATTYLDTADVLSGRTTYFYSVMTANLTQDTSQLAPPVSIRPLRPIHTTYPKLVEVSLINKAAWLNWSDVRQQDNVLTSFVLQRRDRPAGIFQTLSPAALTQPSFVDSTLQAGQTVWYRVAALTAFGDTTQFSDPVELSLTQPAPEPVRTFYVRNISEGIEVSWPSLHVEQRERYGIYRREATQDEFMRIGEVAQPNTLFVDRQVQTGTKYVYSVSAIEAGNRESQRVNAQALTRE